MRTDYEEALREIAVMRRIVAALDSLDERCQQRILTWLNDKYAPKESE